MKQNILSVLALLAIMAMPSCSDMMDIDNSRVAYEDEHKLDNANDSIYSVIGILTQLQQVADRIVIAGELRGDLMTVNPLYASTDLQQINSFDTETGNKYAGRRDFYSIINNCNYIIARMDTSITEGIDKVMVPEYAQVKTLRAYTYWQMALMFGHVNWFTWPLTNVDDVDTQFERMDLDRLATTLIADLEPVANTRPLDYGSVDGRNSSEVFYPTKMMLGDLYLFLNQYERAAQAYYDLIYSRGITISYSYASYWQPLKVRTELAAGHQTAYGNDVVTRMIFDSQLNSFHSQLAKLTYSETPNLLPTENFMNEMNNRMHFHSDDNKEISRYMNGDTRGCAEYANGITVPDAFGPVTVGTASQQMLITKFYNNLSGSITDDIKLRPMTSLTLISPSTVYLRYAEAINRLGYHTTAFAVLKYGLTTDNINDTLKVDSNEVKNLPAYIKFDGFYNVGTAMRGCGYGTSIDNRHLYAIPADADTTDYVERAILQEMAAESCFEGHRFFDLLCMSRHRQQHPLFMAEQVAGKYADPESMLARLKDINAWFLK